MNIFLMRRLRLERSPGYTVARLGSGSGQPASKAGTRTTLITLSGSRPSSPPQKHSAASHSPQGKRRGEEDSIPVLAGGETEA